VFPRAGLGFVEKTKTFVTIGDSPAFACSERPFEVGQHIYAFVEKNTTFRSKNASFLLENVIPDIRNILKLYFKEYFDKNSTQNDLN
jgi:hypothetical protein